MIYPIIDATAHLMFAFELDGSLKQRVVTELILPYLSISHVMAISGDEQAIEDDLDINNVAWYCEIVQHALTKVDLA